MFQAQTLVKLTHHREAAKIIWPHPVLHSHHHLHLVEISVAKVHVWEPPVGSIKPETIRRVSSRVTVIFGLLIVVVCLPGLDRFVFFSSEIASFMFDYLPVFSIAGTVRRIPLGRRILFDFVRRFVRAS